MANKQSNSISAALRYRRIVVRAVTCLVLFGVYGLWQMNKNEFPSFTIRQAVIIAVAPGDTPEEIEQQVVKPLEDYIFTYKEVNKAKTHSTSSDGMAVIQVQLNDDVDNKDEFWSKFKHGVDMFKAQLPQNVMGVIVNDDFGDTSALLIALESDSKTYRELDDYIDNLKSRLRKIDDVGRMTITGMRKEQIGIYIDNERLKHYGISDKTLMMQLFTNGFTTSSGRLLTEDHEIPIYIEKSHTTISDLESMAVMNTPTGEVVRLRDVAEVKREFAPNESFVTTGGNKCLVLSVEMKEGRNIVKMGEEVKNEIAEFEKTIPSDVRICTITDQSEVVDNSIFGFLKELLIAIIAVVIVVMLLMPMRVALVAASTIPISIFISMTIFYILGVELNTVTLAALIVTLGMIVDNSIVIIDGYVEMLGEGMDRQQAAIKSATHFKKSILSATLAISVTFFPFLMTMTGMTKDFLLWFPWATLIVLMVSYSVALFLVPFLQYYFIRKPLVSKPGKRTFLDILQGLYDKVVDACFRHPKSVFAVGSLAVVLGIYMFTLLPQRLLPTAERNQFAVEIFMPSGTSLKHTTEIADSLERILMQDPRVKSISSFHGLGSPRFHTTYAPQAGGSNFAQFIVNTENMRATEELLDEYADRYASAFPDARVRFKQLSYNEAVYPIEVRIWGDDITTLLEGARLIEDSLRNHPDLSMVWLNAGEPLSASVIVPDKYSAHRHGLTDLDFEMALASETGEGVTATTIYEGRHDVPVKIKTQWSNGIDPSQLKNVNIPVAGGVTSLPLRQVAQEKAEMMTANICHRNGVRCYTIQCELKRGRNAIIVNQKVQDIIDSLNLPNDVTVTYGGDKEKDAEDTPHLVAGLCIAIIIIFVILVFHFRELTTAMLILACLLLCLLGATSGIMLHRIEFGVTCVLGIVALMGILVRNGIIMFDYTEELTRKGVPLKQASIDSAKRRMRPIFLTSMAASMGVLPMLLGNSGLWKPMGITIFYGTLITMILILTVMPVAYWKTKSHEKHIIKNKE